jgi:hypothetical protein
LHHHFHLDKKQNPILLKWKPHLLGAVPRISVMEAFFSALPAQRADAGATRERHNAGIFFPHVG